MGYSASALVAYLAEAGGTAAAAGTAAEAGTAAAAAGTATAGTTAAVAGTTAAAAGTAAGGVAGTGIGLGTVASGLSLASTAYALTKGVPKVPAPGTITPTDNGKAIADASDVAARDRAKSLAGGATSTMLTGGRGSGLGATTSSALGGV